MIHRTTFYLTKKERIYKFDYLKSKVFEIFNTSKGIYGSRKIAVILFESGVKISDRTLRNYMVRWKIISLTRKKKRKIEIKNINARYNDLVKRNYNPNIDNIIATDVSYIPANAAQNHVYLSVAISHKTKKIESWKLSEHNDIKLVIDTLNKLDRKNFILHSDHGFQYSSYNVMEKVKNMNAKISMSRIGNSLDNREVEYFFGCLKGEYLNKINTQRMKIKEIYQHIKWYISWYNNERIQKVLNWKTPAFASVN
ncbi:hypothetical protein CXP39_01245 [Mesoplasma syrphidae]|uniref:Integrase catalytic domain-containing protein n=1 Tax=Mesoplasma syrphidae TaxID=225999 RepID=A0A2K9C566_9MOLU|nr:DDE-type integrase/transposase/recombinase [Mesoplasma syrphidae]AUF83427.1 hypothetical protein CXP39_01245 [Mesoplasma syrphidae]